MADYTFYIIIGCSMAISYLSGFLTCYFGMLCDYSHKSKDKGGDID